MTMLKLTLEEIREIARRYGLSACRVKGTTIVNIRKHPTEKMEDISWDEFGRLIRQKGLAVYKAKDSDFLRIMKDK